MPHVWETKLFPAYVTPPLPLKAGAENLCPIVGRRVVSTTLQPEYLRLRVVPLTTQRRGHRISWRVEISGPCQDAGKRSGVLLSLAHERRLRCGFDSHVITEARQVRFLSGALRTVRGCRPIDSTGKGSHPESGSDARVTGRRDGHLAPWRNDKTRLACKDSPPSRTRVQDHTLPGPLSSKRDNAGSGMPTVRPQNCTRATYRESVTAGRDRHYGPVVKLVSLSEKSRTQSVRSGRCGFESCPGPLQSTMVYHKLRRGDSYATTRLMNVLGKPSVPSAALAVKRTTLLAGAMEQGDHSSIGGFDSRQRVLRTKSGCESSLVMPHGVFALSASCGSAGGRLRHRDYFLPVGLAARPQRGYFARRPEARPRGSRPVVRLSYLLQRSQDNEQRQGNQTAMSMRLPSTWIEPRQGRAPQAVGATAAQTSVARFCDMFLSAAIRRRGHANGVTPARMAAGVQPRSAGARIAPGRSRNTLRTGGIDDTCNLRGAVMLVLARKENEVIVIGNEISIMVVRITGGVVRLGIKAPDGVPVHRKEVWEAINREGRQLTRRQETKVAESGG